MRIFKIYCRFYQSILRIVAFFARWPRARLLQGENALLDLPQVLKKEGIGQVLIVTDKQIRALGLLNGLTEKLGEAGIGWTVYDDTVENPTVENVEAAARLYRQSACRGIIAMGGGSSIDCAKGAGARLARPRKPIGRMKGLFKVLKKIPPLFAVPTTAGTGSEATVAAVITADGTHEKYAVNDFVLVPRYAVLDPVLTVSMPPRLTAYTGIDALTHAVEAYVGMSNKPETLEMSRKAVKLIFENLPAAYADGSDLNTRRNMQTAAYEAGMAFTRAYVGYAHALAHSLGGLCGVNHGLGCGVFLPLVLEAYGDRARQRLGELGVLIGAAGEKDSPARKAEAFIEALRALNKKVGIPECLQGIKEEDLPVLADRAYREANPFYPVPKILTRAELIGLLEKVRAGDRQRQAV